MSEVRDGVLARIASDIASYSLPHTLRIGIDGRTAVGKTTFADDLGDALAYWNRNVIRAGIDGFHNPVAIRYARGRNSAEGYYHDARNLPAVRKWLLDPLGPEGSGMYAVEAFDLERDCDIEPKTKLAAADSVLLLDGSFLQRPELGPGLDMVIYLSASRETSRSRGIGRDGEGMSASYDRRYLPAFDMYAEAISPELSADMVVDVTDLQHPVLIKNVLAVGD